MFRNPTNWLYKAEITLDAAYKLRLDNLTFAMVICPKPK